MRTTFVKTLLAIAREDPSVMLLTGDLGFTVFEEFRDTLSTQYVNVGVAEQNMVGVATGLALSGKRVFIYSIIPFATLRCLEHIRNDICYHRVPVCIVGVGGGYSYGHMGSTHHALEDIAVMRSLPNMTVTCPGDPLETQELVRAIAKRDGPCYLRLGKAGEPTLHKDPLCLEIGKSIEMRRGRDLTLIATGVMLETAMRTADALHAEGIEAGVLSMHTVKPIDVDAITRAVERCPFIVTMEEHSQIGGLGSAVAETLSAQGLTTHHLCCAAPDAFAPLTGSQGYLRSQAGLTSMQICARIQAALPPLQYPVPPLVQRTMGVPG